MSSEWMKVMLEEISRKKAEAEQARLEERLQRFGACADAIDLWSAEGVSDAQAVPALPAGQFIALADKVWRPRYDAR